MCVKGIKILEKWLKWQYRGVKNTKLLIMTQIISLKTSNFPSSRVNMGMRQHQITPIVLSIVFYCLRSIVSKIPPIVFQNPSYCYQKGSYCIFIPIVL